MEEESIVSASRTAIKKNSGLITKRSAVDVDAAFTKGLMSQARIDHQLTHVDVAAVIKLSARKTIQLGSISLLKINALTCSGLDSTMMVIGSLLAIQTVH